MYNLIDNLIGMYMDVCFVFILIDIDIFIFVLIVVVWHTHTHTRLLAYGDSGLRGQAAIVTLYETNLDLQPN